MSGTLIDPAGYNLNTLDGQTEVIEDMIDQNNSQFDALSNNSAFSVQNYKQLSVDLIQGSPAGVYSTTYTHGLGYPPVVMGYMLQPGTSFYAPLPYVIPQFGAGAPANFPAYSNQYFYVDNTNLYYSVWARPISGSFPDTHFTAAFYIFSVPIGT